MIDLPFNPGYTAHPGELAEMFMEDIGINSAELARRMGVNERFVKLLLEARENFNVGTSTAEKLGKAFGMSAQFWLNAEAGYRKDLIRLTPKRVGLFDDWESFYRREGQEGTALAKQFLKDLLATEKDRYKHVAAALQDSGDFFILAEYYEGTVFSEIMIGYGRETFVAIGPNLQRKLAFDRAQPHTPDSQDFSIDQKRRSYDYSYAPA